MRQIALQTGNRHMSSQINSDTHSDGHTINGNHIHWCGITPRNIQITWSVARYVQNILNDEPILIAARNVGNTFSIYQGDCRTC
jgi:hypothetical protein